MDLKHAWMRGFEKVNEMEHNLNGFPHITKGGEWLTHQYGHWTGGFWIGLLWLNYLNDAGKESIEQIQKTVEKLERRMTDNKTHDMGFIFGPSCVLGNRITPNPEFVKMATAGARNMMDLYEKKVGLILAWDEPGYEGVAIVDTIMNLPLMVWAAEVSGNLEYKKTAINVANHILNYHIRKDYSTYHMVCWDTKTFAVVEQTTHQGFSKDSCWSRGQAWALYGFSNMYRYTLDPAYLETANGLADYYWNQLDDDLLLPRWDFHFKNQKDEPLDAAAGSIAASGMLLLANLLKQHGELEQSEVWYSRSQKILEALISQCLYSDIHKYGIIENVTVDKPRNSGIGESAMYGDYYFMEGLYRLLNKDDQGKLDLLY